jgi:hypothetical protein
MMEEVVIRSLHIETDDPIEFLGRLTNLCVKFAFPYSYVDGTREKSKIVVSRIVIITSNPKGFIHELEELCIRSASNKALWHFKVENDGRQVVR